MCVKCVVESYIIVSCWPCYDVWNILNTLLHLKERQWVIVLIYRYFYAHLQFFIIIQCSITRILKHSGHLDMVFKSQKEKVYYIVLIEN